MKATEATTKKEFDAVKYMRQQRDNLSKKLANMSNAGIVKYFDKRKNKTSVRPG